MRSRLYRRRVPVGGDAHDAIAGWRWSDGQARSSASWVIYCDPGEDPATNEVQVFPLPG